MHSIARKTVVAVCASIALVGASAAPAVAQQNGLVNVTVTDVLNDAEILNENNVGIGVAAGIAANVCDVSVGVLARQLSRGGDVNCESDAGDQAVEITQN